MGGRRKRTREAGTSPAAYSTLSQRRVKLPPLTHLVADSGPVDGLADPEFVQRSSELGGSISYFRGPSGKWLRR
ncbi:hypothetical protein FAIPA1_350008 [Frankia sp. AiPs1]